MIAKQIYLNNHEHHILQQQAKMLGVSENSLLQDTLRQALHNFETEPLDVIQPSSTLIDEAFIEDLLALMQDIAKNYRFPKGYRFNRHQMYAEDDRYQRFS